MTIFQIPRGETALPDDDPVRNSDELGIGEFNARTGVAIVEQYVDAGGIELLVQRIGGLLDERRLLVIDRHQDDLERRDRLRPEYAVGIVILFDGRGNHPSDPNSVTAHEHGQGLTLLIQHAGIHGGAVQLSPLGNIAHFDAAPQYPGSPAGGARGATLRTLEFGRYNEPLLCDPNYAPADHCTLF